MSEITDLLSTITEFSIGLAGFSGVIGIFIRGSGGWLIVDRFRINNLLVMSLTPGFLAFFTMGLIQTIPESLAIRLSAAVFAIAVFLTLVFIPRARKRVPDHHQHLVGLHIFVPMSTTFFLILVTQALIAIGVITNYIFTIYYYALVVMLLLAVFQFVRLILARPEPETKQ